ncbi:MAG: T9SS type A sorting domain-containing protein [Bacteroidetes bacterium]|nr:T9SS type A sorting domain-containing protein [Bacteroidota bacterium]MBL7104061.1 T9SS type A sorting domain-containing protein [Bacteroidales bacterium]
MSSTTYLLEDICFTDQNNGWVVGGCGTIRHTINGGIADGEEFIIQNPKFNIQCYPNPFLKKTAIKYTLDKQSLVLLEIFDIKGQKITSLVNEKQYAGKYQIEFDASELPAGIYFYSLKTSQGKQTGKMVLMR